MNRSGKCGKTDAEVFSTLPCSTCPGCHLPPGKPSVRRLCSPEFVWFPLLSSSITRKTTQVGNLTSSQQLVKCDQHGIWTQTGRLFIFQMINILMLMLNVWCWDAVIFGPWSNLFICFSALCRMKNKGPFTPETACLLAFFPKRFFLWGHVLSFFRLLCSLRCRKMQLAVLFSLHCNGAHRISWILDCQYSPNYIRWEWAYRAGPHHESLKLVENRWRFVAA